jgi:hypothetical protein
MFGIKKPAAKKITVAQVSEIFVRLGFATEAFDVKAVKTGLTGRFMVKGFGLSAETFGSKTKAFASFPTAADRSKLITALKAAGVKFDESDNGYFRSNPTRLQFSISYCKAAGWNE